MHKMGLGGRVTSASSVRSTSSREPSSGIESRDVHRQNFPKKPFVPKPFFSSSEEDGKLKISPDEVVYKTSSLALLRSKRKQQQATNNKAKHENGSVAEHNEYLSGAKRVLGFMYSVWQKQQFCDMVLNMQNGELYTHKVVFAANSEELAEKFSEFAPEQVILLDLTDFEPDIVVAATNFLYTTDVDITDENVAQLLTFAIELGLHTLVQLCKDHLNNYTVHNAILYQSIAEAEGIDDLAKDIFSFVCMNFSEIIKSPHFVLLHFDRIAGLISKDSLSVKSELEVFYAVVTWVGHNRIKRLPLAPMLLKCVRFQLIQPQLLATKVESVDWIFEPRECHNVLFDAYKFHCLQMSSSYLISSFPRQSPRAVDTTSEKRYRTSLHYIMKENPYTKEVEFVESSKPSPRSGTSLGLLVIVAGIDLQSLNPDVPGRTVLQLDLQSGSREWTQLAMLQHYTHHHGAAVLGGMLYVVGGALYDTHRPNQLGTATDAVLMFDPESKTWSRPAPMNEPRAYHSVVVWGSYMLALGGESDNSMKLDSIEYYDPSSNSWQFLSRMPGGSRLGAASAVYGDLLYVVGGFSSDRIGSPVISDVECYSLLQDRWTRKKPLKIPRCHANLAVALGRMFLIGGRTRLESSGEITSLSQILEYDVVKDTWSHVSDMATPRHDAGVAVVGTRLYIAGGMTSPSSQCLSSVECLDLATGRWIEGLPPLPYPATGTACIPL